MIADVLNNNNNNNNNTNNFKYSILLLILIINNKILIFLKKLKCFSRTKQYASYKQANKQPNEQKNFES